MVGPELESQIPGSSPALDLVFSKIYTSSFIKLWRLSIWNNDGQGSVRALAHCVCIIVQGNTLRHKDINEMHSKQIKTFCTFCYCKSDQFS